MSACFRKVPRYAGVFPRCVSFNHVPCTAAIQSHCTNAILKRVSSSTGDRFYPSAGTKNSYSTSELPVEDADLFTQTPEHITRATNQIRNVLYPDSDDTVILKLKNCDTCDAVFDVINEVAHPKPEYYAQALLVLRDLYQFDYLYESSAFSELKEKPPFNQLIERLISFALQLTMEELSCCILYFRKLGVEESKIISLITVFEEMIKGIDADLVTIDSLCRVCVCVHDFQNIWAINTLLNILPLVTAKLDSCSEIMEFRKITGCVRKMYPLLSPETMRTYVDRCSMLLPKREDPTAEYNRLITVVRCLSFLNFKAWGGNYSKLSVELLLSLLGSTHYLTAEDQYIVYFVAYDLQEPYQILRELKSVVQQKQLHESSDSTVDLRSAALLYVHAGSKDISEWECSLSLLTYVDSIEISNQSQFHRTIHYLSILHIGLKLKEQLLEKYWNRIINFLNIAFGPEMYSVVLDACYCYSKFYSQMKYSHRKFESNAVSWLRAMKKDEKTHMSPFTKCMLDLQLLYFDCGCSNDLESMCEYFVDNVSRFEPWEAGMVTVTLCNSMNRIVRRKKSSPFFRHYVQMLSALNNSAIEFLKYNRNERMDDLVHLFRNYSLGNTSKYTELYRLIIDRLKEKSIEDLSSKRILCMIPSSYRSQTFEPSLVDKMVQYNISRKNVVSAFSLIQLMNYMFSFGYTPSECDEFVNAATQVIVREKNELARFELVNATLSLCFYNHLPRELNEHVFSVDFLNSVHKAQSNMSKVRSRRLHEQFMLLNRAVCLDFPNFDTPWFHDRYCQEKLMPREFRFKTELQKDIEEGLRKVIINERALEVDAHSPYYHKIDFILYTDKKGEPVDPLEFKYKPQDLRKIAILVNTREKSTPYYLGKGRMDMIIRQLEKLEYKVAVINAYLWNSMFMSEPFAKETYLCDTIWSR